MATTQFKVTFLASFVLSCYFILPVNSAIGPLVLQMYPSVALNQPATYVCTSNTGDSDPTFVWSVREHGNLNNIIWNNIPGASYNGGDNSGDGQATSSVTFTVLNNYLNQDVHCGAREQGSSAFSSTIFGQILPGTPTTGGLGQACNSDNTCSVTFSTCVTVTSGNECQCSNGYYQSGASCIQKAEIGGVCVDTNSCRPSNSFCNSNSRCECNNGYVLFNSECVLDTAQLDESCANGETCVTSFSQCSLTPPFVCVCHSNYYRLVVGSTPTCQARGGLGGACTNGRTDSCLPANSVCSNSICDCGSGYTQSGSNCILDTSADLGEPCDGVTVFCTVPNSQCTGNPLACQCRNGFYSVGNTCNPSGGIGSGCSTSNPASCSPANSECSPSTSTCVCVSGYVYVSSTQICDLPAVGQSCSPTVGCKATASGGTTTNPGCVSGTCACPTNYYALNGQCFRSGGYGESCTTLNPASCSDANTACNPADSTCVCANGYNYVSGTQNCDLPTIGQSCLASVGCRATAAGGTTTNPICISGTCACATGYFAYNGQCFQKIGLGQGCNTAVSDSCSDPNAICVTSSVTCQCKANYVASGGVCILDTGGEYCQASSSNTTPRPGVAAPVGLTTPDVKVARTCYEVNETQSVTMGCEDTKKSSAVQFGDWDRLIGGTWTEVVQETNSFINGDAAIPSLTVSNAKLSYAGQYRCYLCYGSTSTRCTVSEEVTLYVRGTGTVTTTVVPDPPQRGNTVTLTCSSSPPANSYRWLRNGNVFSTQAQVTITNIQSGSDGLYVCEATNSFGTLTNADNPLIISVQYAPVFSITGGGNSQNIYGNLANEPITIECVVSANPGVQTYYFYNSNNQSVQSSSSKFFEINQDQGYGTYSCIAENSVGSSEAQYFVVQATGGTNTGAATEGSGLSTGTIAAIVLGLIFLLLLIIIIIVCCCSYGWCRKKEKVQPEIIEQPKVVPYIARPMMSAGSVVSRRDVGILVKGRDFPDDQERWPYKTGYYYRLPTYKKHFIPDEEPHYAIPVLFPTVRSSHIQQLGFSNLLMVKYCKPGPSCSKLMTCDAWDEEPYAKPVTYITPLSTDEFVKMSPEVATRVPETGVISRKPPMITQGEPEERYTTPRYHLKPALNGGPIISMYDDTYNQPRPLQLPALDTQYLYVDNDEEKRKKKKRKKHRHERRETSPRRSYYEADPEREEVETKYAEVLDSRSDDLVVVPDYRHNYFE